MDLYRFGRINVLITEELAWQIRSDGKEAQVYGPVLLSDLFEHCFLVPRIARIVNLASLRRDY